jgi:hypothetical protein
MSFDTGAAAHDPLDSPSTAASIRRCSASMNARAPTSRDVDAAHPMLRAMSAPMVIGRDPLSGDRRGDHGPSLRGSVEPERALAWRGRAAACRAQLALSTTQKQFTA